MLSHLVEWEENHALWLRRRLLVKTGDLVDAPGKKIYKCGNCGQEIYRYPSQTLKRVYCKICRRPDPIKDFWSRVDKTSSLNGCWLWTGEIDDGYGRISIRGFRRAHRLSWFLLRGPIPKDQCVLHQCPGRHNRLCVNPDHLMLGDKALNGLHTRQQGTAYRAPGESNWNSKLTNDDVLFIKANYIPGRKTNKYELAAKFNVTAGTILDVATRSWDHLNYSGTISSNLASQDLACP